MNIFVTDPCPQQSAKNLDNKRVIKMILESAQMLSTAAHELGYPEYAAYKSTHKNHPCNVWVRKNKSNYLWLFKHFIYLCGEYKRRYNREHKSYQYWILFKFFGECVMPKGDMTPFVNCARNKSLGIDYTNEDDVHLAYQLYLNERWENDKKEPKWD